ncbi:[FeFe] hydrogenase H-cluster radical SAM maturase HydE [Peptococcaceae bacterium 1198_IL3148]
MNSNFAQILNKAVTNQRLTREDIITLLGAKPGEEQQRLFDLADQVRKEHHGDYVHLRGIIEFSNHCRNDCFYCGLRRSNKDINRYRMTVEQVLEAANEAVALGFKTIVLQSGEDLWYDINSLCEMVRQIKAKDDVAITLSVGERSAAEYYQLRQAGADRFLLKHETADESLFNRLRPGTSFSHRIKCLKWLKEAGFQVGSGNMIGLPGQTLATIADDILLLKQLDVEMAGIGPFIPHHQTPLAGEPPGDLILAFKTLAVTRLLLPQTHLPATTAAGTLHPQGRAMALKCGANVIMPNATPLKYRQLYQIYPNKAGISDDPRQSLDNIVSLIHQSGREVATNRGDSPKIKYN